MTFQSFVTKHSVPKSFLTLAMAASLLGSPVMNNDSNACSGDSPIIGSVCIMAAVRNSDMVNSYVYADGRILQIAQNSALFSLLGATYGGNGTSTFGIPDLRGRVIVGTSNSASLGRPAYNIGNYGGAVTLTVGQLPAHTHLLTTAPTGVVVATGLGTLAATTTMTGLTATTTIGTLAATTNVSGLTATLKAASGGTGTSDATSGALLSVSPSTKPYLYTSATPSAISMNSGSIAIGGTATTTLIGAPSTTITGSPTTQLSGAPSVAIAGATGYTGGTSGIPIMPPYMALHYYFAIYGVYPVYD
jgi:microcystin-dependent protein